MTIQVHSGAPNAVYDSYASLEAANTFYAVRGNMAWSETDTPEREAALVRATDYIDATYSFTNGPLLEGAVHPAIVKATLVMAFNALTDTFTSKAEPTVVEEEKELSGVGKKRQKFDASKIVDPYPMVTAMLAPLTGGKAGGVKTGKLIK